MNVRVLLTTVLSRLLFRKIILFIFSCAGSSLLRGLFSGCGKWGLLSSRGAWASQSGGFHCGAQALGRAGSGCCGVRAQ